MIKLVFSDLRDHAATWIGAFAVAVACGYIGGWAVSIEATGAAYPNLADLAWTVLPFSLIAAAAVLASVANLAVSTQRRSYALWQVVNMRPRMVSAVVLVQLALVALLGAAAGTMVSAASFAPLFPMVFSSYGVPDGLVLSLGLPSMPAVWLGVAGVFLVGGLKGARSAGRTPPLTALREPEPVHGGMTWVRVLLFAVLAAGSVKLASFVMGSNPDVAAYNSLYVPILVVATMVPAAPAVLSTLLGRWTALVPHARWNAWYLARHAARHGLSASSSVETPIMVGFGLVAGVFSLSAVLEDYVARQGLADMHATLDWTSTILLFGGPVLLCAVGAAVSVVMSSRTRTRDVALLVAGGAEPRTLLVAAGCEALIHVVTATLAGAVCVAAATVVVALPLGVSPFARLAFGEGLVVSLAGFALVLAATLAPTAAALRREVAPILAVRE